MRTKFKQLLLLVIFLIPVAGFAQGNGNSFTLQQAIDYALTNSFAVKNAQLDVTSASAKVGETRAIGLPQVNFQAQLQHSFKIQNSIFDNRANSPFARLGSGVSKSDFYIQDIYKNLGVNPIPDAPVAPFNPDAVTAFPFGLKNNGLVTLNASQIIFNGSYLVGLKASKTYKELSQKNLTSSKIVIVENVSKAYYAVLVNKERLDLLKVNVNRLDSLFKETSAMYKNGFVEQIDVDRIEVQYNNLKVEEENVARLLKLSSELLKFQMNYPLTDEITVSDQLSSFDKFVENASTENIDYTNRIEYSLLQTQKQLNILDVKNLNAGRLPTLNASATYGYNPAATRLRDITQSARWINYSFIAFQFNFPLFTGLGTHYKIQQKRIELQKTENNLAQFKKTIDLQIQQSNITLQNAIQTLKTQKRNLALAEKVAKVTQIKYKQGVGSNIEVINAEAAFKEAQTNYYSALYNALISKTDLDKSNGTLLGGSTTGIK